MEMTGIRRWLGDRLGRAAAAPVPPPPAADAAAPEPFRISGADARRLVLAARSALPSPVPLCKVCDLPEFNDREWLSAAFALGLPTDGTYVTKKYWEYTHLLYGLRRLGRMEPALDVLSVGCGIEPPMYYLANYMRSVVGIDLFGDLPADVVDAPEQYATFPYRAAHLRLLRMNGCRLEFPDASFDVAFSLSSIEHFGGHAGAAEAMREIGRVLRPGGLAAIATELLLADASHPEYFTRGELDDWVIRPSGLRLVEPLDTTIHPSLAEHYVHVTDVRSPLYLRIHDGPPPGVPFASVMLFLEKAGG